MLLRDGLGATNHMEATGFIRSDKGIEYPDIQYHFVPLAISYGDCFSYLLFCYLFLLPGHPVPLWALAISYVDCFILFFIFPVPPCAPHHILR